MVCCLLCGCHYDVDDLPVFLARVDGVPQVPLWLCTLSDRGRGCDQGVYCTICRPTLPPDSPCPDCGAGTLVRRSAIRALG